MASPPKNAEVDCALTTIVGRAPMQWPAVSTRVGEITVPLQSVVGVRTATAKLHCSRLAGPPPITLARACGLASAKPAVSSPISAAVHRAAAPALAILESIPPEGRPPADLTASVFLRTASSALQLEGVGDLVGCPGRRIRRRGVADDLELADVRPHQLEQG